jgi:hypothetical protein
VVCPYEDHGDQGWWAAAQDTRRGRPARGGSLPPQVYQPAGWYPAG